MNSKIVGDRTKQCRLQKYKACCNYTWRASASLLLSNSSSLLLLKLSENSLKNAALPLLLTPSRTCSPLKLKSLACPVTRPLERIKKSPLFLPSPASCYSFYCSLFMEDVITFNHHMVNHASCHMSMQLRSSRKRSLHFKREFLTLPEWYPQRGLQVL